MLMHIFTGKKELKRFLVHC